ncbi:MAG TPA: homocysteine S-methyltransferase family protein [Bryobacteraceae bacterium]|nr:homocysteine S-methyltransferase family protein [Bryobacteraceae bacterium]
MPKFRKSLPQLEGGLFLADGGLETTLVFHEGVELPLFAAFDQLKSEAGERRLRRYYQTYSGIAKSAGAGMILESVTWRASHGWGEKLGYTKKSLAEANRRAIGMLEEIRTEFEPGKAVISGCVGPRGDGYNPSGVMTALEAEDYHAEQVGVLAGTAADMLCAMTLNYADEAIGIARAASRAVMPVAISFTVETDGKLPGGQSLGETIHRVDDATGGYASYYMVNCAHPEHFDNVLGSGEPWAQRIKGLRANASRKSHAELDESDELDAGNPEEFGELCAGLVSKLPGINVLGGCCGTDHRHVEAVAGRCAPLFGRTKGQAAGLR